MEDAFTMTKDYLAWKYQDPTLALVYGIVARFSNMGKKIACYASIDTLAKRIVYSPALVTKKLKILEEDGYLIDLDSRSTKSSHRRIITTKLEKEEAAYFEFTENYFRSKVGICDHYLCFDAFAKKNKLQPYLSLIDRVKKPRGRNGYFSRLSSTIDEGIINDRCSNHQPLIILSSTISKEDTIDTKETKETGQENSFSNELLVPDAKEQLDLLFSSHSVGTECSVGELGSSPPSNSNDSFQGEGNSLEEIYYSPISLLEEVDASGPRVPLFGSRIPLKLAVPINNRELAMVGV